MLPDFGVIRIIRSDGIHDPLIRAEQEDLQCKLKPLDAVPDIA
jgi:hypothetical protein